MSEKLTEGQILDRANKAKQILESPMYNEGFEMVKKAIITRIEECPLSDTAVAEDLRKCLRLLRDVRANLDLAMKQGKIVSFKIEQERLQEDKRKRLHLTPNFYR
jgi:hypothetical protein